MIGCPKILDRQLYAEKREITISLVETHTVVLLHGSGGIEYAAKGRLSCIPCQVFTIGINGTIMLSFPDILFHEFVCQLVPAAQ